MMNHNLCVMILFSEPEEPQMSVMQPSARRALDKAMDKIDNWSMSTGVALESRSVHSSEYASLIGQTHPQSEIMPPPSARSRTWLVSGLHRGMTSKINSIPYINSIIHSNTFLKISNQTLEFFITISDFVFSETGENVIFISILIALFSVFLSLFTPYYYTTAYI